MSGPEQQSLSDVVGNKAIFLCGPLTSNLEKGFATNAIEASGVKLADPENLSDTFCKSVTRQERDADIKANQIPAVYTAPVQTPVSP